MGHTALYRKWRPQTFDDLVGQEHISRTLINAINTEKVSHAYLFCGSRGTGKTTSARILARSLNCESRVDGSPCNACPSCLSQSQGSDLDVIEIDAASNRGISEIKSLIEQVRFASVSGKYKVYIIDEFHMLTTEAFNAILKTLEEPPEKVVFILATTEAHKILPTIISRCQRFDFQRIPVPSLITRLKYISQEENIKISDESILSIARKANGGLRDALSLLDQISSFSIGNEEISTELVNQVLGMVSSEFLIKLAESIAYKDHIELMKTLSELLNAGNDPVVIVTETITFFRHLLVVKSAPDMVQFLEVPLSNLDNFKRVALMFGKDDILETLGFLNEAIEKIKKTQMAQLWLEINMVQLCKKPKSPDTSQIPLQNPNTLNNTDIISSSNISEETLNKLLNKISYLESKVEELSKKSFNQVERVYHPQPENRNNSVNPDSQNNVTEKKENNSKTIPIQNFDNADLWHKILKETKIKSVAASALLVKGKLTGIDREKKFISVNFEDEAYVEMIKSKTDKVEQALVSVFNEPYKLIMEHTDLNSSTENTKLPEISNTVKPEISNSNIEDNIISLLPLAPANTYSDSNSEIQHSSVATLIRETVTTAVVASLEEKNLEIKIEHQEEKYLLDGDNLIKAEIKESREEYSIEITAAQSFENDIRKQQDDKYFKEVSEAFKGKIIKKTD